MSNIHERMVPIRDVAVQLANGSVSEFVRVVEGWELIREELARIEGSVRDGPDDWNRASGAIRETVAMVATGLETIGNVRDVPKEFLPAILRAISTVLADKIHSLDVVAASGNSLGQFRDSIVSAPPAAPPVAGYAPSPPVAIEENIADSFGQYRGRSSSLYGNDLSEDGGVPKHHPRRLVGSDGGPSKPTAEESPFRFAGGQ